MKKEFLGKVIALQQEIKVNKDLYNEFGKFNYRSAEQILEAVKPKLEEKGLLLHLTDKAEAVGDWNYITAHAILTDGDDVLEVTASAREQEVKKGMDASQITGSASSYARKYALAGLLLLDDGKDPDADDNRNLGSGRGNASWEAKKNVVLKMCREQKTDMEALVNYYGVEFVEELNDEQLDEVIKTLRSRQRG